MINDNIASKDKTIVKFLVGAVIVNNPQLRLFRNKLGPLTWIVARNEIVEGLNFFPRRWRRRITKLTPHNGHYLAVICRIIKTSNSFGQNGENRTNRNVSRDRDRSRVPTLASNLDFPLEKSSTRALSLWSSCCTRGSSKNRNSPIFYCTSRLFIHSIYFCLLVTWKRLGERLINTHLFEENLFITCVYHGLNKTCWKNLKKAF